ncbi:DUF881 domain-containing protein [uncultured Actinomyces sp.]|jgi:hypothetical protein|uniref:DUF881 domain-containing protein n=1 Tax=uncultured Actinomyces sp. TaxID=249061 RepID=UPI001CB01928|nr:DUF881 domain-containing protein [uncultured Actinomyces sp.]MBF0958755.1 DUF881 domain-containing protein [Actinomyces sp.]
MSDDIIDETATADEAGHAEGSNRARRRSAHREEHAAPRLWARARGAFFALPRGLHVVMLIIFMILGFALATQVRAQRSDPLEGLSEQDLVTVLDELGTREQNLRERRAELTSELEDLQSAADEAQAREQASAKAALQAQIAAGTVAVQGPGVSVSVLDPGANLSPTQFVMTLGELRNAGAEAIDLNGVRLTTRSAFTGQAGAIVVDGTPIASPYTWTVIGESQTIATALEIQAGSASQMRAKGATVTITPTDHVTIDSLASPRPPQYATYE